MASILNNKYAVGVLAVIAVVVVGNAIVGMSSGSTSSPTPTPTTHTTTPTQHSLYSREDYSAKFPALSITPPDSFRPLIAGVQSVVSSAVANSNTDIPTIMTKNEPNWAFTGTTTLNGTKQVLFENGTTGQSNYISEGSHWKSCTVEAIQGDNVTLKSDSGTQLTLLMQADQQEAIAEKAANNAILVSPINPTIPAFSGPISNQFQLQPKALPAQQPTPQVAQPAQPMQFRRGGRGGRFRRGGGRGPGG